MGDPQFVDGRVRVMLDEARRRLFERENPRAGVPALVQKWAEEFSPANPAYEQTLSVQALDAFLKSRGFGSDDIEVGAPIKALIAQTLDRFVSAAVRFDGQEIRGSQFQFELETAIEDCQMLLRGLDNPAD